MSSSKTPLISANFTQGIDNFLPFVNPKIYPANPSLVSTLMWRKYAKQAFLRTRCYRINSHSSPRSCSFVEKTPESGFPKKFKLRPFELIFGSNHGSPGFGFGRNGEISSHENLGKLVFGSVGNLFGLNGFSPKGYASVAEAVSSTDVEEDVPVDEEFRELLQDMGKEKKREVGYRWRRRRQIARGVPEKRYAALKRRQVKIETQAWEQAAKEYRELMIDMCEQKLAPNLPFMKSLFLGWFEPLTNAIKKDQEIFREGKNKTLYAPFFDQLPAEKMAIITMHKLMGLLMTGQEHGDTRVVQASCVIGDAIEQEVKIHRFLEERKMKKVDKDKKNEESEAVIKEEEKLKKKVTHLMKQQKLRAVRQIVNQQDSSKPWGQSMKAKVGSRLIELLTQTAYIQPPLEQLGDGSPDVRPAFVHTFKIVTKDPK